jgi:hypothetical protein
MRSAYSLKVDELRRAAGMLKDAGAEEERALHGGVGEEVEEGSYRGASADGEQHEAVLARGRGREQPLEVALGEGGGPVTSAVSRRQRPRRRARRREQGEGSYQRIAPAATSVAEWRREETGVGPAIASRSQPCSGVWSDLPIAARSRKRPAATAAGPPTSRVREISLVLACAIRTKTAT